MEEYTKCPECKGMGLILVRSYGDHEGDCDWIVCPDCKGDRVIRPERGDEEPKPVISKSETPEPTLKFKVGDNVCCMVDGRIGTVTAYDENNQLYHIECGRRFPIVYSEGYLKKLTPKREIKLALKFNQPISQELMDIWNNSLLA